MKIGGIYYVRYDQSRNSVSAAGRPDQGRSFGYEDDPENYELLTEQCQQEHELELANLNSWEQELELEKNNLETKLNEINTFESSWTKLLQTNIKNDFSYGGVQQ